ncbi:GNAT family N-acetyltransferase [Paenibacillus arenilitoris]|uniref:GNAT family N-acetyltransferase n=1 Tax=Paenibacillus arenilitoris TaxID=2772299 RepID=A0A927CRS2_9BACL|nr:GNAT family N-acetyltransferase [Paenibacillus arenilitoris]MBD2872954.1 GNAT family N-acetyltransferase [Paenibacillus arenilitoris]
MPEEREALLRAFGEWTAFVSDLGRYGEWLWNQSVAPGKWTVREAVAHMLKWDEYFFEGAVAKVAAGLPLTVRHLDYDEFNREAADYGRKTSVGELTGEAVRIRTGIIETISGLSDEQYAAAYRDADGHPFDAAGYLKDFKEHDRHHMGQLKDRLSLRIEEMSLNGWPALQTVVYDGWLLRFADGYTKRSNSVSAIYGHTLELAGKLDACERLYGERGIRTAFKVTPFVRPNALDGELEVRGYERIDHTLVKTVHLEDVSAPSHDEAQLESEPTGDWLRAVAGMYGLSERQQAVTRKMMEQSPLPKCFAVLQAQGVPVACGIAVLENGWVGLYDVVTGAEHRGRGYGEQLVLHLLSWGKRQGAKHSYLLVVKSNAPANRLYDKIGFKGQYDYWYRVKKD